MAAASELSVESNPRQAEPDSDRLVVAVLAAASFLLVLLLPMFLLPSLAVSSSSLASPNEAAEATVGIGVILRATTRRLLRSGASNLLRTTVGAVSRASARTLTRRVVRIAEKYFLGMMIRDLAGTNPEAAERRQPLGVATALGVVALAASFWGVLQLVGGEASSEVLSQGQLHVVVAGLLASVPLLVQVAVSLATAHWLGTDCRISTPVDGLILQAYFTGSGSFLPMATDVQQHGTPRAAMLASTIALAVQWGLFLVLHLASGVVDAPAVQFAAAMFLVYAFVNSFPIAPLDGYALWRGSKTLWVVVWLPILVSFLLGGAQPLEALM